MQLIFVLSLYISSLANIVSFAYSDFFDEIPIEIFDALKKGDSEKLSTYLNENVELVILDNENVYSRTQATLILADFFKKHKPENFVLLHQGGTDGSLFAIGNLSTSSDIFRVYFLLKKINSKYHIHQLRIELENE